MTCLAWYDPFGPAMTAFVAAFPWSSQNHHFLTVFQPYNLFSTLFELDTMLTLLVALSFVALLFLWYSKSLSDPFDFMIPLTYQAFFRDEGQMGIPLDTVAALSNEGINTVDDLEQIYPEDIERISKIFRSQDPAVVLV